MVMMFLLLFGIRYLNIMFEAFFRMLLTTCQDRRCRSSECQHMMIRMGASCELNPELYLVARVNSFCVSLHHIAWLLA